MAKSKNVKRVSGKLTSISAEAFERMTVIQQVRQSFKPGAKLAGFVGLIIGGLVPFATYVIVHYEVTANPWLWLLVGGGLLYSALTVYGWAFAAFGSKLKAGGFCILLEGILTFVHADIPAVHVPLSLLALVILVFVNAVSAACSLQVRKA